MLDVNQVNMDEWSNLLRMSVTMAPMREVTASYLIGRADRLVRAQLEEVLAESGLSLAEFTALSVLAARPGLSNARLARRSLVTPQAMHKVVRSLERTGLVERTPVPEGGRALATTITPAGAALVAKLLPRIRRAEERTLHALDADDRRELVRLLTLATSAPAPVPAPSR